MTTGDVGSQTPSGSPLGLLTLLALRGVGTQSAIRLAERFATLEQVRGASSKLLESTVAAPARASIADASSWDKACDHALHVLERAERERVHVLTVLDDRYPPWLRIVSDRPPVLFLKGTLRNDARSVACIGTREPSRFGEEVARRIVARLAEAGWSIVSGLALGVDALSHRAALDARAHTVAILANGLETVYPKANAKLAAEILNAGGALLSEQPFGVPAVPRNLVQRDRLQSGMSAGTVVMQTDIVGGSMHTVRFTLMQGRLLFAPMPTGQHADEPKSRGIVALGRLPARELAAMLRAEGDYAEMLEKRFGARPAATSVGGREDYDRLLAMLEDACAQVSTSRAQGRGQLGFF